MRAYTQAYMPGGYSRHRAPLPPQSFSSVRMRISHACACMHMHVHVRVHVHVHVHVHAVAASATRDYNL